MNELQLQNALNSCNLLDTLDKCKSVFAEKKSVHVDNLKKIEILVKEHADKSFLS